MKRLVVRSFSLLFAAVAFATVARAGVGVLNQTFLRSARNYYHLPSGETNSSDGEFKTSADACVSWNPQPTDANGTIYLENVPIIYNQQQIAKPTAIPPVGMALSNWLLVDATVWLDYSSLQQINNSFGTNNGEPLGKRYYKFLGNANYDCTLTTTDFTNLYIYNNSAWQYYLFPCFGWLKYTIKYDACGGSSAPPDFSNIVYTNKVTLSSSVPTKTGYAFSGWKCGNGRTFSAGQGSLTGADFGATANGTVTLTAQWTANKYSIVFHSNHGSGATRTQSNVTYDQNVTLNANTFTRTGYTFKGWASSATGTVAYSDKATFKFAQASTLNLYAVWKETNKYTVTFNGNGSTSGSVNATTQFHGIEWQLPTEGFTKTGYTLAGWTNTTANLFYELGATVSNLTATANGSVTLSAVWTPNTYYVKFDACGGDGKMPVTNFVYDAEYELPSNKFTKPGYTFNGWATNNTNDIVFDDGATVSNLTAVAHATNTFFAVWGAERCTIHFDRNGGEGSIPSMTVSYESELTLPSGEGLTKNGCRFKGWSVTADGDVLLPGSVVQVDAAFLNVLGAARTLYAAWERTDEDLLRALDLDARFADSYTLSATGWEIIECADATSGTCLAANGSATLTMQIVQSGTLSFKWQTHNQTAWPKEKGYKLQLFQKGETSTLIWTSGEDHESSAWEAADEISIVVTDTPVTLEWTFETKNRQDHFQALLDAFVWTPAPPTGFIIRLR